MSTQVISLLSRARQGERAALDELVPVVYAELRAIASGYLRRERPNHTLQATALINEVYLRLVGADANYLDRTHFLGVAAFQMRQILTEHARRRNAAKRGGGAIVLELKDALDFSPGRAATVIALDDALTALAKVDLEQARMVELRFYAGMTAEEIAIVMQVSVHRVRHRLRIALARLHREVSGTNGEL